MNKALAEILAYLDSCDSPVDLSHLSTLLRESQLCFPDVERFCKFSPERYARNLVSHSKWYELLVLCWSPGQASLIHDHFGSSCSFKIMQGEATEIKCVLTSGEIDGHKLVKATSSKTYGVGAVCASASQDIHMISNASKTDPLVTVHIYSPPLHMNTYLFDPAAQENSKIAGISI